MFPIVMSAGCDPLASRLLGLGGVALPLARCSALVGDGLAGRQKQVSRGAGDAPQSLPKPCVFCLKTLRVSNTMQVINTRSNTQNTRSLQRIRGTLPT